jgi:hypothetical protein
MSETPWRPTKEYFERNDRAKILRNLCWRAVNVAENGVDNNPDAQLAEILDIDAQLQDLGIEPDMHSIIRSDPDAEERRREMKTDPVLTSEWIAGQARMAIERQAEHGDIEQADVAEHDLLQGESPHPLIELRTISPRLRKAAITMNTFSAVGRFIDYLAGPSE